MAVGLRAPDFELPDEDGVPLRLSTLLRTGPGVLFFHRPAGSGGCTAELRAVGDLAAEFTALGAWAVGISPATVEQQRRFAEEAGLPFPLLADVDAAVCDAYGLTRKAAAAPIRRRTVVVGGDGLVRAVIRGELRVARHAVAALEVLRRLG